MKGLKFRWQKELRGDTNLTATEYRVLTILCTYANEKLGNAHPGRKHLAEAACVSEATVKRTIRSLARKRYIDMTYIGGNVLGKGMANTYRLTLAEERKGVATLTPFEGGHVEQGASQGGQTEHQGGQGESSKGVTAMTHHQVHSSDHSHHHSVTSVTGSLSERAHQNDDEDDFEVFIESLEEQIGALDEVEQRVAEGMYQNEAPFPLIRNKIAKDRRGA